jgi:hypothetical protein
MFGCCCANKKALKNKEQQKNEKNADARVVDEVAEGENTGKKSPLESPQKIMSSAADAPMSPVSETSESTTRHNDKSSSSEEGNNKLNGLIMSDGLVGESWLLSISTN